MKISILTPDLSHNCLGRAYILAKMLQRTYDVEIVGPIFKKSIWAPLENDNTIAFKSIRLTRGFRSYLQLKKLAVEITGDVIYACKPLFSSFGLGIFKKILGRRPLILDIDDWEIGFLKDNLSKTQKDKSVSKNVAYLSNSLFYLFETGSYWNNLICEKLTFFADRITVSNSFLQKKFDGTIIWHARDTDLLNPDKYDKCHYRKKCGISKEKKIIMFFGTPRLHKGIETLISAVSLIKNKDVILALVGIGNDSYSNFILNKCKNLLNHRALIFGLHPFDKIPEILCMCDIAVIPQKNNFATIGQFPAKVFDAMAMAKPIIATRVNDLPKILDGSGWIIEPEDEIELANAIENVLDDPEEAKRRGIRARENCAKHYSWNSQGKKLVDIFKKYN